jgi:hypothetical protein
VNKNADNRGGRFINFSYIFYRRKKEKSLFEFEEKPLNLPGQVWKLICDSSKTPTHETPLGISL